MVTVLRDCGAAADRLLHPCPERLRQLVDLNPGIVHVELAGRMMAGGFEQPRDRVPQRRAAPVPHVKRPRRVGRYKLHIHLAGLGGGRMPVGRAFGENAGEDTGHG